MAWTEDDRRRASEASARQQRARDERFRISNDNRVARQNARAAEQREQHDKRIKKGWDDHFRNQRSQVSSSWSPRSRATGDAASAVGSGGRSSGGAAGKLLSLAIVVIVVIAIANRGNKTSTTDNQLSQPDTSAPVQQEALRPDARVQEQQAQASRADPAEAPDAATQQGTDQSVLQPTQPTVTQQTDQAEHSEAVQIASVPAPQNLTKVSPRYPPLARDSHIGGVVQMQLTIAPDGTVRAVEIINRPSMLLIQAAEDAVKQWTYTPYVLQPGQTMPQVEAQVNFAQ